MNWKILLQLLTVFQILDLSQNSYVQKAKHRIRSEVRSVIGDESFTDFAPHQYEHFHENRRRVHRSQHHHRNRWSSGHRKSMEHHHFTGWSAWSACNNECIKRRERYCKLKRKCGVTKHVEERKCWHCHPMDSWNQQTHKHFSETKLHHQQQQQQQQTINHGGSPPQSIIINAAAAASSPQQQLFVLPTQQPTLPPIRETIVHHHIQMPVLEEIVDHHHQHKLQHQHQHQMTSDTSETVDELMSEHIQDYDENQQHYPIEESETLTDGAVGDEFATSQPILPPSSIENFEQSNGDDFYVFNTRPTFKKHRQSKPIYIDDTDYAELEAEQHEDELEAQYLNTHHDLSIEDEQNNEEIFGPLHSKHGHHYHDRHGREHDGDHYHKRNKRKKRKQRLLKTPHEVRPKQQRNLLPNVDDGIEGDTFQYEDFDLDQNSVAGVGAGAGAAADNENFGFGYSKFESQYSDSYEDSDYNEFQTASARNSSLLQYSKEKATPDALVPRHRRLYSKWSRWTKCSPKCTTRRYKKCRVREQCGREVLREIAYCYTEGSFCQQWLQAQIQKTPPYELRPIAASRRRDISVDSSGTQSNSIVGDFIMNSKGYRGPEYTPMKLKCGIAPPRNTKRNMYNMLKIIGGKASRKGEWPWQVAIFNRFKEAFCGGTLIAPQWVLTAAHCVRKVLYVRIGEHNLDYEDGTELQLRVLKSFKHPNFDKKTVDSDVALLRLPKSVNTTTWIGFSCLPRPYQPLPKNVDCTVIGWGKRRNRDAAGTSVLHQAEVPIISMDNCRSVYQDYTITKNMFCAGHKRGRIDTCAGDSGGPLLCRDTTKPNHPWTIFGITSFGDGCAKRNKFGIYAKVPNYVDWVWSVINCNGNCKLHQRDLS